MNCQLFFTLEDNENQKQCQSHWGHLIDSTYYDILEFEK
jgi:hypothetical protein